jgi:SAM-dependent methyltransferase
MTNKLYDHNFYSEQGLESLELARIVAPLVMRLATTKSVIDIGCGLGGWLRAFSENGAEIVRGIDGNYIDRSKLYIPSECFTPADLSQPLSLDGRYDLAVCLEVAEHLNAQAGTELIVALTSLAQLVLFSAAVPGQGGTGHLNEQWSEYWRDLFQTRGFKMLDLIRPLIREDRRVCWWYRQNISLYASEATMDANPNLRGTSEEAGGIEWIHINMLRPPRVGVRNLMTHLKPVLSQAIRKRLTASLR